MSAPGVQESIALLIVLAAAAWLTRRWWRRRGQPAGCEHCPAAAAGAPPCQAPPGETLVQIGDAPVVDSRPPGNAIRR